MELKEITKPSFVLIGYSAAGNWKGEIVYPIPQLWVKATKFIHENQVEKIVGVCLPPRSDQYFYTCGMELESVDFYKIEEGMTVHTFPEQKYVMFKHIGKATEIPGSYSRIWNIFDQEGYQIKMGMPEIEIVDSDMFGKEESDLYEMEIWIPIV